MVPFKLRFGGQSHLSTQKRDGWKLIKAGACSEWRVARADPAHSERRQFCPASLVQTAPSTPRLLCASPAFAQPPTAYQWRRSPVCANGNYNMGSFVLRDNGWVAMGENRVMQCGVLMTAGLMGPPRAEKWIERKVSLWGAVRDYAVFKILPNNFQSLLNVQYVDVWQIFNLTVNYYF